MVGGAAVGRLGLRSDLSGITLPGTIAPQCLLGGSDIAGGPPEDGTASFCAAARRRVELRVGQRLPSILASLGAELT